MCVKSKYSVEGDAKQMSKQASNVLSVSNVSSASNVVILQGYSWLLYKNDVIYINNN